MLHLGLLAALVGCPASRPAPEPVTPAASASPEAPPTTEAPMPEDAGATCLDRFSLGADGGVLAEHRQHAAVSDFHTSFTSAVIDPAAQRPVKLTERFQVDGRPLLWYSADQSALVVDASVFSDLLVVDATNLRIGEQVTVGLLLPAARGKIGGRELTRFLLESRAIATWVHLGAELCLRGEETTPEGVYHARYTGEHTFFTNEKNVRPLKFDVRIDPEGDIVVRGGR